MSDSDDKRLWSGLQFPFGHSDAIDKIGTTAAPLLAGFAFTLIGLTIGNRNALGEPDLALLLLVVSGVSLVSSVQFNFNARRYYFSPGAYFDLQKLAEEDGISPATVKEMGRAYLALHGIWADRSRSAYNFGVAVLFFGVASTLIPATGIAHMAPLRAAAVALTTAAGLVEVFLMARERLRT